MLQDCSAWITLFRFKHQVAVYDGWRCLSPSISFASIEFQAMGEGGVCTS